MSAFLFYELFFAYEDCENEGEGEGEVDTVDKVNLKTKINNLLSRDLEFPKNYLFNLLSNPIFNENLKISDIDQICECYVVNKEEKDEIIIYVTDLIKRDLIGTKIKHFTKLFKSLNIYMANKGIFILAKEKQIINDLKKMNRKNKKYLDKIVENMKNNDKNINKLSELNTDKVHIIAQYHDDVYSFEKSIEKLTDILDKTQLSEFEENDSDTISNCDSILYDENKEMREIYDYD